MSKFWSTGTSSSSSDEEGEGEDSVAWDDKEQDASIEAMSEDPNAVWKQIRGEQVFREPLQSTTAKTADCTRIVCISDTHGKHRDISLPGGDILIHGGDFSKSGEVGSIQDLSSYFRDSGFEEVICIAGNHDMTLHPEYYQNNWGRFHHEKFDCDLAQESLKHCIYLKDSSYTTKKEIEVFGSPWSPEFFDWAFNLPRGASIREVWDKIPSSTDVLITHGPPLGRGDVYGDNGRAGCHDLLVAVQEIIRPRVHIFGHIHEGAGITFDGQVLYINASNLNVIYQAVNHPIVVDIPHDSSKPARVVPPECKISRADLPRWCKENSFHLIARLLDGANLDALPSQNDLVGDTAYEAIANELELHRDRQACHQLQKVLSELYAQSFTAA
jgi:hypothetical protein